MNTIKAKRGRAKGCLTRALIFTESINLETPISMLKIRLAKLDEVWSDFVSLQDQMYEFIEDPDYVHLDSEFAEYEAKYFQTYSVLSNAISERKVVAANTDQTDHVNNEASKQSAPLDTPETVPSQSSVHLPKISIPTFGGDYKDWPAFRDLFTGTVDSNASLTCTQKFQYLKSFLRGDAANLVKHITCSESNYIEAWDRLERRFDQSHLITQSFIQSFLSLPLCTTLNPQLLRKISDGADEAIRGLKALDSTSRDPWLIYILVQKLDHETRRAWAEEVGSRNDCTIIELLDFLQSRCSCLETCYTTTRSKQNQGSGSNVVRSHFVKPQCCIKCKSDHILPHCKDFMALNIEARRDFVKLNSLCFNCLQQGHASNKCRSKFRCRLCNSRHHSLVHLEQTQNSTPTQHLSDSDLISNISIPLPLQGSKSTITVNHSLEDNHRISTILPTAIGQAQDKQGVNQLVRILFDSGSQVSFISEKAVQGLGLLRKRSRLPIIGIASTSAGTTNGLVSLTLFSRFNAEFINIDCHVLPNVTSSLPPFQLVNIPETILSMELADPNFYVPGPIDILIGADKFFNVIQGRARLDSKTSFTLFPTIFGWVVAGANTQLPTNGIDVKAFCTRLDYSQQFDLERFWKMEEIAAELPLSLEEELAEEIFVKGHFRRTDGRYEVELPFKPSATLNFGDSFNVALKRFHAIERRFQFNNELKSQYSTFIKEYLSLGHMEEIPSNKIFESKNVYYLPHHAVFKADSSTTKIRVVFDASAKVNNSSSLNEVLLVGPKIQRDLFSICLRYRRHLYVISGDIEKMYRQIWITPKHTDFQRIIWRENPNEPLKHYRLLTVTYGTSAAPFLAVRTLKQLGLDSAKSYPLTSQILQEDFYVDDVITGADSVENLMALQTELVEMLKSAGFNLRKWTTNCWPLLISLAEEHRELTPVEFEDSNSIKILGLQWCPSQDSFSFKVKLNNSKECTKRRILSDASRIFDPLGFLAPVVISIKILFQELWRKNLAWDDEVPDCLAHRWINIRDELPYIESLSVPRIMITNKSKWELHAFSDASLDAYAAVVYCRSINHDESATVRIVAAKTRVAPIKVLSLPRLELCGAVLLVRLVNKIKSCFQEFNVNIFAWTDSSIVLHWLSAPPKKWSVFIGNRTSEILSSIPFKSWNHVRSLSNPADIATRGISPFSLPSLALWWNGPKWLSKDKSQWPISKFNVDEINPDQLEERKVDPARTFTSKIHSFNVLETILTDSSNWLKSVRVVAYLIRFISNCRLNCNSRNILPLSSNELSSAETRLIKCAQILSFGKEIHDLKNSKGLHSKSKLLPLCPFIDSCDVLRVGGRLENSDLTYSEKHPIILCKSHPVSKLIAQYIHKKYLHPGVSLMFAIIRQKYYILGCRNLARKIVHDCVTCFRERLVTVKQLMGNLPAERIRYARPFSNAGCDYIGPITLRLSRGRNPKFVKAYIALFVCMVTKAIHLELVGDLTSAAFLLALDRFVSRRGKPYQIWSDNGTNFHGARRILNEMYELLCSQQHSTIVIDHLSKDKIHWKFIPPSSPHFGGLWEAGVKSTKRHLKRVIGEIKLTFEEMYTLLTKIESILNSRPMWQTSDPDILALSPSHSLIGEPLTAVPQPIVPDKAISISTNWSLLQAMLQGFWVRWHKEYLTSLQQRAKWQRTQPNLNTGDVVLVKEPNLPPCKWIIGRITKTHLGSDNKCRVVTIRTKFGEFVRPAVKVAPLPFTER